MFIHVPKDTLRAATADAQKVTMPHQAFCRVQRVTRAILAAQKAIRDRPMEFVRKVMERVQRAVVQKDIEDHSAVNAHLAMPKVHKVVVPRVTQVDR